MLLYIFAITFMIIQNHHFGNKIVLFFISIIILTLYCCYMDHKFLAFCLLLWYGRSITATFIILCEYMSVRKFETFFKHTSIFDASYKLAAIIAIITILVLINLVRVRDQELSITRYFCNLMAYDDIIGHSFDFHQTPFPR